MANTKRAGIVRKPKGARAADAAPRYRVLAESFIDNKLIPAGGEVTYFGVPGRFLQPLNAAAKANKAAAIEARQDPGFDGQTREELAAHRVETLRELDNDLQGVEVRDANFDFGAADDEPLPDRERAELEKHALASAASTAAERADDTNFTAVKLQGRLEETEASKQGATPVLDGKGKTDKK